MPDSGLGKGGESRTQIRNVNMNRLVHANRQLKFNKRSQLFIGLHNKASGVLSPPLDLSDQICKRSVIKLPLSRRNDFI